MKTLHLTNCWHASSGGVSTFYRALFETAEREEHSIRLVVPGSETSVREVGRFGRIYTIEAPRAPINREYRLVLPHRYLFPRTALQRILNDEQPDLVEVSDKYALPYLAGLLRTGQVPGMRIRPTVVGLSHERMDENVAVYLKLGEAGQRFSRWYMKSIYFPLFDHHITVSEHTAEELFAASRGHKVRRGIWVAPMGVDCALFTPERRSAAGRARLEKLAQAGPGTAILFYAGRLAPEKNLSLLIETAALLNQETYRLVIAGGGMLLDALRKECADRGLRHVIFAGHVGGRETLADHFANADVFVHPNPREPFGITPLEAMASGLALVAPNTGGVTSYANAKNAWLADAEPEAFAAAIQCARGNGKSEAARETALEYSWPRVTSRYLRIYRELQGNSFPIAPRAYPTPGNLFGKELMDL